MQYLKCEVSFLWTLDLISRSTLQASTCCCHVSRYGRSCNSPSYSVLLHLSYSRVEKISLTPTNSQERVLIQQGT